MNKAYTVIFKSQSSGRLAALRAMKTMGYVVTVRGEWVVRENQDSTIQKLVRIGAQ